MAWPPSNAATGTTISVTAVQTSSKVIKDLPPKGQLNPGDKYQFTEKLLQNGKKIGTDKVTITDEKGNKALADGVFTFKAGTLHAHGTIPFPPRTAIVQRADRRRAPAPTRARTARSP